MLLAGTLEASGAKSAVGTKLTYMAYVVKGCSNLSSVWLNRVVGRLTRLVQSESALFQNFHIPCPDELLLLVIRELVLRWSAGTACN
jgi:hypothetical protein